MKTVTSFHLAFGFFIILFLALPLQQIQAQDSADLEPSETYSREELAQMLAPIALYPDALLSQILMASTYPIEVIEADRWVRKNSQLKGETLNTSLLDKSWDPSVKAICHFPSILALMSERITETTNLGNAFLAQEAEVMEMVQELRAKAHAQGNLTTTSEQRVIVEKETIIIQPADPRVIYVPYYDPFHVYGAWWYPAYHPHYWGPPGVSIGFGISYWPGIYFGFSFGTWSYFDWHLHSIYIDVHKRPRFVRHDRWITRSGHWHHAPRHRRGVAYRNKSTARKYGQYPHRSRDFQRNTRGFPDPLVRDLRSDKRIRIDRNTHEDGQIRIDRNRQQPEPIELKRKQLEQTVREKQKRLQINRNKLERDQQVQQRAEQERKKSERAKRDKQQRQQIDRNRQKRERAEHAQQLRQQANQKRKERERADRIKQQKQQQRVEQLQQTRQQAIQKRQTQKRVKREQQPVSRDNVFNQVGDGKKERQSSKRGQVSRQGQARDSRSKKSRSSSDDRGRRDDQIRNKK